MNEEMLIQLLPEIERYNPRKAKKIEKLMSLKRRETNTEKRANISRRLYNLVYRTFTDCLTKESKNDLTNTSTLINEECYVVESREGRGFRIHNEGVLRRTMRDGKVIEPSYITRSYQEGYSMAPLRKGATKEELEEYMRQNDFYNRRVERLNRISDDIDHKLEIVTFDYEIKDPSIPRTYTEKLIDTLGLDRLEEKDKPKRKQKIVSL